MYQTFPNTSVRAEKIGDRINWGGGYVLEIPVLHHFYGQENGPHWLTNWLEAIRRNLEKNIKHCLK